THHTLDHVHPGGPHRLDLVAIDVDVVVQHRREVAGELPEERRGVEPRRVRDHLHDATIPDLVAVAEGTVDDPRAPVFGQSVDLGQHVDHARGGEHPTRDDDMAADQLDAKASVV